MLNIGFMASYNGSGMTSVLQAIENGLQVNPTVLICNNKDANAFKVLRNLKCQPFISAVRPIKTLIN